MKKLSLVLASALLVGSVFAQSATTTQTKPAPAKTEKKADKKSDKKMDKKSDKKMDKKADTKTAAPAK